MRVKSASFKDNSHKSPFRLINKQLHLLLPCMHHAPTKTLQICGFAKHQSQLWLMSKKLVVDTEMLVHVQAYGAVFCPFLFSLHQNRSFPPSFYHYIFPTTKNDLKTHKNDFFGWNSRYKALIFATKKSSKSLKSAKKYIKNLDFSLHFSNVLKIMLNFEEKNSVAIDKETFLGGQFGPSKIGLLNLLEAWRYIT